MSEATNRTPRLVPERRDARSYPLSPTDGFVLSRVDGILNEADLAAVTGLPAESVVAALAKLAELGLITLEHGPQQPAIPRGPGPQPFAARRPTPAPQPPPPPAPAPPVSPPPGPTATGDEAILAEDNDLEPELRRRILDAFRTLEERDHYSLLGVGEGADRKAVKRAYYELAAAFHPDRYFRKRLGSFKVRMEVVFTRLTIAHDILSDREKRTEYDAYLGEQRISRSIEENLARGVAEAKRAEEAIAAAVRAEEMGRLPSPTPAASPAPKPTPMPTPTPSPTLDVDLQARKNALARRLLGGARPPSAATNPAPSGPPQGMSTADAVASLKRRYEERLLRARASESRKFAGQGETAAAAGDHVTAANMLRIAANLAPDDASLQTRSKMASEKADVLLRETYTKQAQYEQAQSRWTEAARSWTRVCKVSPDDHNAHERAANAFCKAEGDMHDAVKFALRACELQPRNALYRVTLASCYSAAGLALNAKRELDTAAQLAPHDGTIQSMIKRVEPPA